MGRGGVGNLQGRGYLHDFHLFSPLFQEHFSSSTPVLFSANTQETLLLCYIPKGNSRTRVTQRFSRCATNKQPTRQPKTPPQTAPSAGRGSRADAFASQTHPNPPYSHLRPPGMRSQSPISGLIAPRHVDHPDGLLFHHTRSPRMTQGSFFTTGSGLPEPN